MERKNDEQNPQGLIPALKNSFLLWLLVPLLVPAFSFVVYLAAYLILGPAPKDSPSEPVFFNIDLVNSFLIALVVLFFVLVAIADKLGWLFFRKTVPAGEPADPATRIRLLRERLAKIARKVRDSSSAERAFLEKASTKDNRDAFASGVGRCLDNIEELAGRQFRTANFDLWERCTMPSSCERIVIDFSLVGDLLAALQDCLSQLTLQRFAMIQRLYHRPWLLDPFQDMCNLYESMSDLIGKDSHNATNDNHPDAFTDRYSDALRVDRLSERYVAGVSRAAKRLGRGSVASPVRALFVGCGWKTLLSAVIDKVRGLGISVEWTFADVDQAFPGNSVDLPADNDPKRLVRLAAPFFGPYSQFAKWKDQFDVVLYAHCLQHSAKSCKDPVFDGLLRCARPGGTAMLAMASSWDPQFDGCAVEGLATHETYKLEGKNRESFESSIGSHRRGILCPLFGRPRDFSWKPFIRGRIRNYSVSPSGIGAWRVECGHRNEGHVLKTCGRYLFYRHRETGAPGDGYQIWSFLVNEPVGDAERTSAFVKYAANKLAVLGERGAKTTAVRGTEAVFVESGDRAVLVLSADVFRAGTGTTPMKRDTDRFFCLLCSRASRIAGGDVPDPRKDRVGAVAAVWDGFAATPREISVVLPMGDRNDAPVFVFVRPGDSLHPTAEHLLFVFLPSGVWRSFLPKTCQFPLDLFEKKPDEWLVRCTKEFEPFGIRAALDPPTITRRMSHVTRMRVFEKAGYSEVNEYYHQILADVPSDWKHAGVPDGVLSGKSDVDRDARFNELPQSVRLELLDKLNVQDVLVTGVRAVPQT